MPTLITGISWNRAIIELTCAGDEIDALYLYHVRGQRFIPFEIERLGDHCIARLNVAIAGGREPLNKGEWIICNKIDEAFLTDTRTLLESKPHLEARMRRDVRRFNQDVSDDEEMQDMLLMERGVSYVAAHPYDTYGIAYSEDIASDVDRFSRFFRYGNKRYAYSVSFVPKQASAGNLYVVLDVGFYMSNPKPRERYKSKRFKQKRIMSAAYRFIDALCTKKGHNILFFKQNGEGPTENMEALQRRMLERGVDKDFNISYRYRNVFGKNQNIISWLTDMFALARADYVFVDDYTPILNFIRLNDKTVLTQIWHAGVGFKSVGYARFGLKGSPDPYASGHRAYTYALVGNDHLRDIYSEVFGIEPQALLATGMPRLDHFLDEDSAQNARRDLYAKYPFLEDGRVILFAPTFRGAGQKTAYYPYDLIDMDALYRMCVDTNSYFIFEMHHFIKEAPEIPGEYADRIVDLSSESINALFHISDVLITDYSSCFYDYLLLEKPVVLFVPDKVTYSAIRGTQRSVDDMAPGEVCETFDALLETLITRHYEDVPPRVLTIDRAAEHSGLASDRVIDAILYKKDVPGVFIH